MDRPADRSRKYRHEERPRPGGRHRMGVRQTIDGRFRRAVRRIYRPARQIRRPLAGGLLDGVLFDSWECKTQTWTPEMEKEFVERTGYGLRKWIPALFGYVIDTPEETARFLNDWRRVVGNLFAENFFGNMARRAREQGLSISYETAAGDIFRRTSSNITNMRTSRCASSGNRFPKGT